MGPERLWTLGMHDGSVGSQGGRVSVHPLQFKSQLIVNRFGLDHCSLLPICHFCSFPPGRLDKALVRGKPAFFQQTLTKLGRVEVENLL